MGPIGKGLRGFNFGNQRCHVRIDYRRTCSNAVGVFCSGSPTRVTGRFRDS